MTVDERLNDRDYGPWTGHPRAEVLQRFRSIDAAPGVETSAEARFRARTAFLDIVAEYCLVLLGAIYRFR
ncbi:histidine phosphatase family protein [Nocardia sp. NPDC004604]|uniref:histidine phosphatase family protein n=1 Tax=Nocardia sp. NPDC004604 TaxID=3157013 RepID=UPI0033B8E79C